MALDRFFEDYMIMILVYSYTYINTNSLNCVLCDMLGMISSYIALILISSTECDVEALTTQKCQWRNCCRLRHVI